MGLKKSAKSWWTLFALKDQLFPFRTCMGLGTVGWRRMELLCRNLSETSVHAYRISAQASKAKVFYMHAAENLFRCEVSCMAASPSHLSLKWRGHLYWSSTLSSHLRLLLAVVLSIWLHLTLRLQQYMIHCPVPEMSKRSCWMMKASPGHKGPGGRGVAWNFPSSSFQLLIHYSGPFQPASGCGIYLWGPATSSRSCSGETKTKQRNQSDLTFV